MKALTTKYITATDAASAKIRVYCPDLPSIAIFWDDDISTEENHRNAVKAFMKKYDWTGDFVTGDTGTCLVHVFVPHKHRIISDLEYELLKEAKSLDDKSSEYVSIG
jgi:hypothetical protein